LCLSQRENDMSYQTLMVHLDPTAEASNRLRLAVSLAKRFSAELIGLTAAQTGELFTAAAGLPAALIDERRHQYELAFQALHRTFADQTEALAAKQWRAALAPPAAFAAENARAADLIIISRDSDAVDRGFALKAAPLLMAAGRPILLAPRGVDHLSADRIVVGWKDGRPARLALQQALPMLAQASHVTVVGVGEETSEEELADVCGYLGGHGAHAVPRWVDYGSRTIAATLYKMADDDGADLIVTGAYGQNRLQEWAWGGVTEDLLTGGAICCLMAH